MMCSPTPPLSRKIKGGKVSKSICNAGNVVDKTADRSSSNEVAILIDNDIAVIVPGNCSTYGLMWSTIYCQRLKGRLATRWTDPVRNILEMVEPRKGEGVHIKVYGFCD